MRADKLDALLSSRKAGAHLREVIVGLWECPGFFRTFLLSDIQDPHDMGEITVLYFAAATTATGCTSETFSLPEDGLKLSDLAELIASRHPNTGIKHVLERSQWAADSNLIHHLDSFVLRGGEEVAVIPPVSGG